jgi:hypothetical protein
MPRVLLVASPALLSQLDGTVLSRGGIERVFAPTLEKAIHSLDSVRPDLVILGDEEHLATVATVRRIRNDPQGRTVSLAIVADVVSADEEQELKLAGANVVLGGDAVPRLWDAWIEELLTIPRRREVRVPVRFAVWSHAGPEGATTEGACVNVSTRGLLVDTDGPLEVGARLDVWFRLPGDFTDVKAVGQVVRDEVLGGQLRCGIEFLILRDDGRERIQAFVDRTGG